MKEINPLADLLKDFKFPKEHTTIREHKPSLPDNNKRNNRSRGIRL